MKTSPLEPTYWLSPLVLIASVAVTVHVFSVDEPAVNE